MTYAGQRVIHDADSHLMESPEWLLEHADPPARARMTPLPMSGLAELATSMIEHRRANPVDPATFNGREAALFADKNWTGFGAIDRRERERALDHMGFRSQLVFSTFSHQVLLAKPGQEQHPDDHAATVQAHNRAMTTFCAGDPRLLGVCWVSLHEPDQAMIQLETAIEMGASAIEIPSHPVGAISPTHVDLLPFYARVEAAGLPLLFHIGGGGELVDDAFKNNGRSYENRFYDGEPAQPALIFMGMPRPIEMVLAALIFDRVLEQFPRLMFGVIESGATWVPAFMKRLDLALKAFGRQEEWKGLSMRPSEYLRRQVRFAPFAYENLGDLVAQTGSEMYLFSTDFPHDEGSYDPVADFEASAGGLTETDRDRFYRRNFEEMMGKGLPAALLDTR